MQHLNRAIQILGSQKKLADAISADAEVGQTTIANWLSRGRVPAEYCPAIEGATHYQVTCEQLRPDVRWDIVRAGGVASANTDPKTSNLTAAPPFCAMESAA